MEIENSDCINIREKGIYSFLGNSKSIKKIIINTIISSVNKKIGYLNENIYEMFTFKTVRKNLENVLKQNNYNLKYIKSRVNSSIKLISLSEDYLDKNIENIDYYNLKKIALLQALIHNPKILIIENYTQNLNYSDKKELLMLIRMLKNKYNKIIIFISNDTNFSYECSDYIYLIDEKGIVNFGDKNTLYNEKLLEKLNLEIPSIIKFINECRRNNHIIGNYNNILDLIKAIYRNVV